MHRRLPPLNAVKAFEATARLGTVAMAARELNVTRGAVSQQIAKLEDFLGKALFARHNNQLFLTDVGLAVKSASTEMMDELAAMTERLLGGGTRSALSVSVIPSIGVRWFNRHMSGFLQAYPEVRLDLRIEDDPIDFYRNPVDVRIAYGEHLYPQFVTVPFLRDHAMPMCTPKFLKGRRLGSGAPAALRDEDLIHISWRAGFSSYPTWSAWFALAGVRREPRAELGHKVDMSSLAIDLALSGEGIALGQAMFAQEELRTGALVTPFECLLPLQYEYCAVHPRSRTRNTLVQNFIQWLVKLPARQNPAPGRGAKGRQ
jgi:LysR family transcriptional regulator, glycine cleavage system transcriptional activator